MQTEKGLTQLEQCLIHSGHFQQLTASMMSSSLWISGVLILVDRLRVEDRRVEESGLTLRPCFPESRLESGLNILDQLLRLIRMTSSPNQHSPTN